MHPGKRDLPKFGTDAGSERKLMIFGIVMKEVRDVGFS